MGPVTTKFAKIDPGPTQTFGVAAVLLVAAGAVLGVVAFTAVNWGHRRRSSTFPQVHRGLQQLGNQAEAVARAYFGWLAWALLIVAVVCAVLAATPAISTPFRIVAPIVALAGLVFTVLAIRLWPQLSYAQFLKDARAGFYLALGGFLLIGIGSLLGPGRKR
jgi:hypothetical protein